MKKLLLLAMTMLMAVMLVAGCGSDGPKKMVVGLDDNFAPMGFRDEKQEPVGKFIQHPSNGIWEQDGYGDNPDARPLYLAPGAQTQGERT